MALGVTLQFELGMQQKDVIGEWVDAPGVDGIRDKKGRRWVNGLTGFHIDAAGGIKKRTTKKMLQLVGALKTRRAGILGSPGSLYCAQPTHCRSCWSLLQQMIVVTCQINVRKSELELESLIYEIECIRDILIRALRGRKRDRACGQMTIAGIGRDAQSQASGDFRQVLR